MPCFVEVFRCNNHFFRQVFLKLFHYIIYYLVLTVYLLFSQCTKWFNMVKVETSGPSSIEFVIYLKNPTSNILIANDQLGKRDVKFLLIINIYWSDRSGYVRKLKNFLCTWFCAVQRVFLRLPRHYWYFELNWKFYVIRPDHSWDDICMFSFYHWFHSFENLRAIHQHLCQTKVVREFLNVFWYQKLHSIVVWLWKTSYLQYLHIITKDIIGHLVGTNINDLDVWILTRSKNSAYLGVFTL